MALVCWATVGVLNGQITDTLLTRSTVPPASLIVEISAAHVMAASPHEPTGGIAGAARAVTALLPTEIQHVGTPALAPVLEAVIGVDVRSRGPLGVQSDLSIRGGTFEQAALYVDGIRWSAPQTAHHLMMLLRCRKYTFASSRHSLMPCNGYTLAGKLNARFCGQMCPG